MRIYDISQEIFECSVYPGDPSPRREVLSDMECGDLYNLTAFYMCAHNGTHIDAPRHFIADGETVEGIDLKKLVGPCTVVEHSGDFTGRDAECVLHTTAKDAGKRILIKGDAVVTESAAKVFSAAEIFLIGSESQSVGPENAPIEVHNVLLGKGIVLLEGIRLDKVPAGEYFLFAAPINLSGSDGAPCRAVLVEF